MVLEGECVPHLGKGKKPGGGGRTITSIFIPALQFGNIVWETGRPMTLISFGLAVYGKQTSRCLFHPCNFPGTTYCSTFHLLIPMPFSSTPCTRIPYARFTPGVPLSSVRSAALQQGRKRKEESRVAGKRESKPCSVISIQALLARLGGETWCASTAAAVFWNHIH